MMALVAGKKRVGRRTLIALGFCATAMVSGGVLWATGTIGVASASPAGLSTSSGAGLGISVGQEATPLGVALTDVTGTPSAGSSWGIQRDGNAWTLVELATGGIRDVGTIQGRNGTLVVSGPNAWMLQTSTGGVGLARYATSDGHLEGTTQLTNLEPGTGLLDAAAGSDIVVAGVATAPSTTSPERVPVAEVALVGAASGAISATVQVPGVPSGLVGASNRSYLAVDRSNPVGQEGYLATIQTNPSKVVSVERVPFGFQPEAFAGSLVWGVESTTGQVLGVDPATGSVVDRLVLSANGQFVSATSISASTTSIWAAASPNNDSAAYLFRIDASSASVLGRINLGRVAVEPGSHTVAIDQGHAWIAGNTKIYVVTRPQGS